MNDSFKLEQWDHSPARRSRSPRLSSEMEQARPPSRFSRHASPNPRERQAQPPPVAPRGMINVVATAMDDRASGSQGTARPSVNQRDEPRRGRRQERPSPESVGRVMRRSSSLQRRPFTSRRGASQDGKFLELSDPENRSTSGGVVVAVPSRSSSVRSLARSAQEDPNVGIGEDGNHVEASAQDPSAGNGVARNDGAQEQGPLLEAAVGDNHQRRMLRAQSNDAYQRALDSFSGSETFLAFTYNLGFILVLTPFCVTINLGLYHLKRYAVHFTAYALLMVTLGFYLIMYFLVEYNELDPKTSPELGFLAASDLLYVTCVLAQVWCLAVTTRSLKGKFFRKFSNPTSSGKLLLVCQMAPMATALLCWSAYSTFGEDIRNRGGQSTIRQSYITATQWFNVPKCSFHQEIIGTCPIIIGEVFLAIKTWLEALKLVLELQMLAAANVLRSIGVELRRQCTLHEEMTNDDIIECTRLFIAASDIVGGLNESISAVSIAYFTEIFPYLTYSVFKTSQADWQWVALNSIFLMFKVGTPLVASWGTRMISAAASKILG